RIGLSNGSSPDAVEEDLLRLTPRRFLKDAHHYLLLHGRYTCKAIRPQCDSCPISTLCKKNL
ncbi:MAG: hypothetical protein J5833_08450, partial [Victivallales bacterium]|nr:hypothetical protein [Victivallales bacterium]